MTLTYLVLCLLTVGLVCFWAFHTYLLAFNYTTIEFLEKRGATRRPITSTGTTLACGATSPRCLGRMFSSGSCRSGCCARAMGSRSS